MKIRKRFWIISDEKEEAFLNKQSENNYLLRSYDGRDYIFEENSNRWYYMVEFFFDELKKAELLKYTKLGYNLIYVRQVENEGYYYYFTSDKKVCDRDRQLEDRYENLYLRKNSTDKFTFLMFSATLALFLYLYYSSNKQDHLFELFLTVLLGGYFVYLHIKSLTRLNDYAKIIVEKNECKNNGKQENN